MASSVATSDTCEDNGETMLTLFSLPFARVCSGSFLYTEGEGGRWPRYLYNTTHAFRPARGGQVADDLRSSHADPAATSPHQEESTPTKTWSTQANMRTPPQPAVPN